MPRDLVINIFKIFFAFLVPAISFAQTGKKLDFELLNGNDGLSQGMVTDIIQDRIGFMWFGTNDGLNKYDGYEFITYRHTARDTNSIADDAIRCVFEDSKGRLWIGTAFNGLDLFDREKGRFIHVQNPFTKGASSNYIRSITEDKTGNLWICTSEGIYRIRVTTGAGKKPEFSFVSVALPEGYDKSYYHLHVAKNGRIYLSSSSRICELKADSRQNSGYIIRDLYVLPNLESDVPANLVEDLQGNSFFWANGKQIWKFNGESFKNPKKVYASHVNVKARIIDSDGKLWIEDLNKFALLHTRTDAIDQVRRDESLPANIQTTICHYLDRTGTLWMGTFGYGILRYNSDKSIFHHILPDVNTYPITSSNRGEVIVNASSVVTIHRDDSYERTYLRKKLPDISSYEPFVTVDQSGNYWFISKQGVYQYNSTSGQKMLHRLDQVGQILIFPPYLDDSGTLWMGSTGFLIAFDTNQKTFRKFQLPLKPTPANYSLMEGIVGDKKGFLWLATVSGLLRFDIKKKQWKHYKFDNKDPGSISSNLLLCVYNDTASADRYLWIGTKGAGLERLDKVTEKFTHYTVEDGLPNNVIYGILPDKTGDLWMSTNNGLSRYIVKGHTFQNFTIEDGLQNNEFNRYAFHKRNDTLYFGGLNGVNYFVPEQIKSHAAPVVFFSGFKLFNRPVDFTHPDSPLKADISYVREILLQYSQNMIGLKFAVADYHQLGRVQYSYMLKGFDEQWIYAGTTREATYTNLDPGHYRLLVKASYDGVTWSKIPAVMMVRIIPPWWKSWWFFVLAAAATVAALYGIYRYRLKQILRVANIRNSISRDLHDEIGSTLSTISIYAKVGGEQLKSPQNSVGSILEKIQQNAAQAQEAMHDIIWSTNTDNDQFENIINYLRGYANQLCDINGYELIFAAPENTSGIRLDMARRREFYLIFKEALTNIVKHASGNKVWIDISHTSSRLSLDIRDNGEGFVKKTDFRPGNGLANMRSRAKKLGGTLEFITMPQGGTKILLKFPMR